MTHKRYKVILFTGSYPYSSAAENTFVEPELPHLQNFFTSVVIAPKSSKGNRAYVPKNVIVDASLAKKIQPNENPITFFFGLVSSLFSKEFYNEIKIKKLIRADISGIVRLILFLGSAINVRIWIDRLINEKEIDPETTVLYTYWMDAITYGACQVKKKYPEMIVISRVHGGDLYEERYHPPYIPLRPEMFALIDRVYADSEKGRKYLSKRYSGWESKFLTSRMGVPRSDFFTAQSNDGVFRVVSCSNCVAVKRIDLIVRGLEKIGMMLKDQPFEWTHIGEGTQRRDIEKLAETILPGNVKYQFLGQIPNQEVINYYREKKIDVFINTSESEGTPVSIMEAQSCGIPVIATAVGGNSEIVSDANGILLSVNPSPDEVASAIWSFVSDPHILSEKKTRSKKNWDQNYNAARNFHQFAEEISALVKKV